MKNNGNKIFNRTLTAVFAVMVLQSGQAQAIDAISGSITCRECQSQGKFNAHPALCIKRLTVNPCADADRHRIAEYYSVWSQQKPLQEMQAEVQKLHDDYEAGKADFEKQFNAAKTPAEKSKVIADFKPKAKDLIDQTQSLRAKIKASRDQDDAVKKHAAGKDAAAFDALKRSKGSLSLQVQMDQFATERLMKAKVGEMAELFRVMNEGKREIKAKQAVLSQMKKDVAAAATNDEAMYLALSNWHDKIREDQRIRVSKAEKGSAENAYNNYQELLSDFNELLQEIGEYLEKRKAINNESIQKIKELQAKVQKEFEATDRILDTIMQRMSKEAAATKIQAVVRGRIARKTLAEQKKMTERDAVDYYKNNVEAVGYDLTHYNDVYIPQRNPDSDEQKEFYIKIRPEVVSLLSDFEQYLIQHKEKTVHTDGIRGIEQVAEQYLKLIDERIESLNEMIKAGATREGRGIKRKRSDSSSSAASQSSESSGSSSESGGAPGQPRRASPPQPDLSSIGGGADDIRGKLTQIDDKVAGYGKISINDRASLFQQGIEDLDKLLEQVSQQARIKAISADEQRSLQEEINRSKGLINNLQKNLQTPSGADIFPPRTAVQADLEREAEGRRQGPSIFAPREEVKAGLERREAGLESPRSDAGGPTEAKLKAISAEKAIKPVAQSAAGEEIYNEIVGIEDSLKRTYDTSTDRIGLLSDGIRRLEGVLAKLPGKANAFFVGESQQFRAYIDSQIKRYQAHIDLLQTGKPAPSLWAGTPSGPAASGGDTPPRRAALVRGGGGGPGTGLPSIDVSVEP